MSPALRGQKELSKTLPANKEPPCFNHTQAESSSSNTLHRQKNKEKNHPVSLKQLATHNVRKCKSQKTWDSQEINLWSLGTEANHHHPHPIPTAADLAPLGWGSPLTCMWPGRYPGHWVLLLNSLICPANVYRAWMDGGGKTQDNQRRICLDPALLSLQPVEHFKRWMGKYNARCYMLKCREIQKRLGDQRGEDTFLEEVTHFLAKAQRMKS